MRRSDQTHYKKDDHIGGRFLVHQVLLGGMGEVYLCLDTLNNMPIALKTFRKVSVFSDNVLKSVSIKNNSKMKDLLLNEAHTWIQLEKHPNIVRCYWLKVIDDIPFLGLEWVASDKSRGSDLRNWLRHGSLDIKITLGFLIDICRGLRHAEQKIPGIVHRDLKPDNVLIDQSRRARITDFGLAKIETKQFRDTEKDNSEIRSQIVGTPLYMSPEAWRGIIDIRSDIYAIGCMLYELLTAKQIFRGRTINELRDQHFHAEIPTVPDTFPDQINHILQTCLAKNQNERFAKISDLIDELINLYRDEFGVEPTREILGFELEPEDYNNRGITFMNMEKFGSAKQDFERAISLDQTFSMAYINKGKVLTKYGRFEEAIIEYSKVVSEDEKDLFLLYLNRGLASLELGLADDAIENFSNAIKLDKNSWLAYHYRSIAFEMFEDIAASEIDKKISLSVRLKLSEPNQALISLIVLNHSINDINQMPISYNFSQTPISYDAIDTQYDDKNQAQDDNTK